MPYISPGSARWRAARVFLSFPPWLTGQLEAIKPPEAVATGGRRGAERDVVGARIGVAACRSVGARIGERARGVRVAKGGRDGGGTEGGGGGGGKRGGGIESGSEEE